MKFWQKAFFITLILFLIAFDVLGFILLERSYALNKGYAANAAQTEYLIIEQSVYERIVHLSTLYTEFNKDNLRSIIVPYANYYSGQGTYLALFFNGIEMFNSNPRFTPQSLPLVPAGTPEFYEKDGYMFCVIRSELNQPHYSLRLVYMKDVSSLLEYRADMMRVFIWVSIIISLILAVILLFLLVNLTRPFRRLSAAALSIAQGDYDKRAPVRGNDEVGQFARSFNLMADKVQEHVGTLTQMSESRERFINDLAHEMRTPITAVMGYAELLKIGNISDAEQTKSIDYIISQSRRIQGMTSKLADLTHMSHGNIEKKPVDIADIIENAQMSCNAQLEAKRITLYKKIGAADIIGDAALLESLIQNLIENAAKYSEDGGNITIKGELKQNNSQLSTVNYQLSIVDCGRGMEESELTKITEPFYRIDKSRSRADGGVGLGLALCNRICEIHGARLEIESKPGAGTKISIHFTTI